MTGGPPGHVLSVAATDPDVKAGNVTFPGPASTMLGYLARPAAPGTYPAVLVNHEIFGLTDHIRDVARRLAKVGYIALAVDLLSRAGGSDKPGVDTFGALYAGQCRRSRRRPERGRHVPEDSNPATAASSG